MRTLLVLIYSLLHFFSLVLSVNAERCSRIPLKYGIVRYRSRGRIATFRCLGDYVRYGDKYAACFRGKWDVPTPKCVKPGCVIPDTIPHAWMNKAPGGITGVLVVSCYRGYTPVGTQELYCDGSSYQAPIPSCTPINLETVNCDFQNFESCYWQLSANSAWEVQEGTALSRKVGVLTGPMYDHTIQDSGGRYLLLETSGKKIGSKHLLTSSYLPHAENNTCFNFWYHMYGASVGSLRVIVNTTEVFYREGNLGDRWLYASVGLPSDAHYKIYIEGTVGGFLGDIAIDDLAFGECLDDTSCRDRCYDKWNVDKCSCLPECWNDDTCCDDYSEYCRIETTTEEFLNETITPTNELTTDLNRGRTHEVVFNSTQSEKTPAVLVDPSYHSVTENYLSDSVSSVDGYSSTSLYDLNENSSSSVDKVTSETESVVSKSIVVTSHALNYSQSEESSTLFSNTASSSLIDFNTTNAPKHSSASTNAHFSILPDFTTLKDLEITLHSALETANATVKISSERMLYIANHSIAYGRTSPIVEESAHLTFPTEKTINVKEYPSEATEETESSNIHSKTTVQMTDIAAIVTVNLTSDTMPVTTSLSPTSNETNETRGTYHHKSVSSMLPSTKMYTNIGTSREPLTQSSTAHTVLTKTSKTEIPTTEKVLFTTIFKVNSSTKYNTTTKESQTTEATFVKEENHKTTQDWNFHRTQTAGSTASYNEKAMSTVIPKETTKWKSKYRAKDLPEFMMKEKETKSSGFSIGLLLLIITICILAIAIVGVIIYFGMRQKSYRCGTVDGMEILLTPADEVLNFNVQTQSMHKETVIKAC